MLYTEVKYTELDFEPEALLGAIEMIANSLVFAVCTEKSYVQGTITSR